MAINATNFPYDLQNITGGGNILEFIRNVNNITDGAFMTGMLFAGFVILFTSMQSTGSKDALLASAFIITVLSVFFRALGFIDTIRLVTIIIIFLLVFAISAITKKD